MRGIITLKLLEKLEADLASATGRGDSFRLCQFFDYVGGTSTGAMIAMGIARGWRPREILARYRELCPSLFAKTPLTRRYRSLYQSEPLERFLKELAGEETTLEPEYLECLLILGPGFDEDPACAWAGRILRQSDLEGSKKMEQIEDYLAFGLRGA